MYNIPLTDTLIRELDMEKLLSVVVPIYNVEPYLDRCMDSIINQTYRNLDIIMVDDGSPDKCPEKCDVWAKKDGRIRVVHKENGGLSDARNRGIRIAKGDYITFVDSDDFIDLNMYSIMMEALERTGAGVATCGRYIFSKGRKKEKHTVNEETVLSAVKAIEELLRGGVIEEAAWDKIYKKELFDDIEFPVGEINEDMPIMPYLMEHAGKVVCTGKPLYYYCENPGSITRSSYNEKKRIIIKHIADVSAYLKPKYPELKSALQEFCGRYAFNYYILFVQDPELKKLYAKDYHIYKKMVVDNAWQLLRSENVCRNAKLELICAIAGIYRPVWKIKHKLKKADE